MPEFCTVSGARLSDLPKRDEEHPFMSLAAAAEICLAAEDGVPSYPPDILDVALGTVLGRAIDSDLTFQQVLHEARYQKRVRQGQ